MKQNQPTRRSLIKLLTASAAGVALTTDTASAIEVATPNENVPTLRIDPAPLFELSPYLYMQMMEPLGTTDGSVEASWNHLKNEWKPGLIDLTRELAPSMIRWGGLIAGYYRWREAVGPRASRKPMHNLSWGGIESNQIGTAEFLDFCKQVQAEPLMCVNFEGEGDPLWIRNQLGEARAGDAQEAADWVDYCNNPDNAERIGHGFREPFPIRYWQLGNETSYSPARHKPGAAIKKTIEFSQAMRKKDPKIKLIAWGDSGWAPGMIEKAGEHFDYIAFHHLFDPGAPCRDGEYQKDLSATWQVLMDSVNKQQRKLNEMRKQIGKFEIPLAMTESHFTMPGRNRCDLNSAWATGVAYARFLNLHQRNGDLLKIANLGDFCGTRWQSNVIMIPTPGGKPYLMPVGKVTQLYRKHTGTHLIKSEINAPDLDITATGSDKKICVHIVNTNRTQARSFRLKIDKIEKTISCKSFSIAIDPFVEITSAKDDQMQVQEKAVDLNLPIDVTAASVTALVLEFK